MTIDHIAIYTTDLEGMRAFYIEYFSGQSGAMYHNPATGFSSYFITFGSGARLELMSSPKMVDADVSIFRKGIVHLSFNVGSIRNVNELTARLHGDGYNVVSAPRTTGDGYYESCVLDPEGNPVEITV